MHVHNSLRLIRVIHDLNKQLLYYDNWRLILNDQDLGNDFLEFSMRVRNFEGLAKVILAIYKHCLYYDNSLLIRNDQDLGNVFLEFSDIIKSIIKPYLFPLINNN